jgi:exosortase A-associated hydrolase 1
MDSREIPVTFACDGERLYGVVHQPAQQSKLGVLIVHGRPATRVGKHRLFVLLARAWASAGYPVMRFDYRGTGDSGGEVITIEETSQDLGSAIDAFIAKVPGLQRVALWGLCGGAADALLYAPRDPRVAGTVMVNPWTYDARVRSFVKLRHAGFVRLRRLLGLNQWIRRIRGYTQSSSPDVDTIEVPQFTDADPAGAPDLSQTEGSAALAKAYQSYRAPDMSKRMAASLEKFKGRVLVILGGGDVGSRTFKVTTSMSPRWRRLLSEQRVRVMDLPEANHSLMRPQWREQAAAWTLAWLKEL